MANCNVPSGAPESNRPFDIAALRPVPYQGQTVITTDLLARAYGTDEVRIRQNYANNEARFEEGVHFFKVTGDDLRGFKDRVAESDAVQVGKNARALILWTARGAARHAKILDTDQAWAMFEKLEDAYFNPRQVDPMIVLEDPAKMRHLLLTYTEKVITLQTELDEARPTVAAFERIAQATGSTLCVTNAAKALQMRPKDLFGHMQERRWIYRRAGGGHWIGYQGKVQAGYLEHKVTEVTRADGSTKITEQVLVTAKGLAKLARDLGKALSPAAVPTIAAE